MLLVLGLFAASGRLIVRPPAGSDRRRGNVDTARARHGVPMVSDLDALIAAVRQRLGPHE